jgi:hypothetical protein
MTAGPFESEAERREAWTEHRRMIAAARMAHRQQVEAEGLAYVVPPTLPLDRPNGGGRPPEGQVVKLTAPSPLTSPSARTITGEQQTAMLRAGGDGEYTVPIEALLGSR